MTTNSDQEKEVEEFHDKLDNILDFLNNISQFLKEILQTLKNKFGHTKLELIVYILMFFVYIKPMMECYGWGGIIIIIITFFVLNSLSNNYRNAKRDVSDDFENKNSQINKTRLFTKATIIVIILAVLLFSPLFVGFPNYFVNPEITITSPISGEVVKIDKDNTFLKISGNSKGLAGNQFSHLFILYRRTDSNKMPGKWNYDSYYMSDTNPCTVYNDGSWECRIRLDEQYAKWVNGTLVVKSPNNPANNISTNVDIVAIITKQSVGHSILTKLNTGVFNEEISDHSWYKRPILFYSALGKGTFHDEDYEFVFENYFSYNLPKHLCESHVIIRPLIDEYNYTEYYTNKLIINITPYNCTYRGDTITISVSSFQHIPIEEAEIYFDGKLINKKTSEDGTLFYTVNASGIYVVTATKNGFVNDTTSLEVKEPKAKFEFSNLLIAPSKVELGKKVNISIEAINSGNAKGEYEVKLVINGNIIDSKTINLDVGENTVVGFIHKENNLGKYTVEIDGETDSFKVIIPSIAYILLLLIVAIISLGAYIFIYRQSDKFKYSQSDKWHNKGLALADLDRYEEALKAYDKAIELKPDAAYAWDNKGVALGKLDRYEEALKAFEKVIELKPDYANAWHCKGWALDKLDRDEEALKAHEKAIELQPDYYGTWHNKGWTLDKLDRDEEALKAHEKAIELKPDYAETWHNKGWTLGKLDRPEEALKAYEKAIELKPDYAEAWYNSACMYSTMGDKEKALSCLRKAVDIDISFKETSKKDKYFEKLWVDESFKKLIE